MLAALFALGLSSAPTSARAAARSVLFVYRYPSSGNYAGVALYHAASRADIDAGVGITRIDLGLLPIDSQGNVNAMVPGFDDTRDYYVALRCYDSSGRESPNSAVGVVRAAVPSSSVLYQEDFESYSPGQDPADWVDSAPGLASPGSAALFETAQLPDGTIALAAANNSGDVHSHLDATGAGSWSSYEYSGRIESDSSAGATGVTVLSSYPDAQFYYRLARLGTGAYGVAKRGSGPLTCAGASSSGASASSTRIVPVAGEWLNFRVRATRFDGRNRIRASVWSVNGSEPSGWQVDCWDSAAESTGAGRIGVYSYGDAGSHWDDLRVETVAPDGAPSGYATAPPPPTTTPTPPPPAGGGVGGTGGTGGGSTGAYTSGAQLEHWWRPGWDTSALGRDFAPGGGIDASRNDQGLQANDVSLGGSTSAQIDLDGTSEALGNYALASYGVADTWSLAAWVRPAKIPAANKRSYVFDLNAKREVASHNRISLVLDSTGRFAVEVADASGRARSITSSSAINASQLGSAWYHVVAVKTGTSSLALYVNGVRVASTGIGVPAQTDAPRVLRIGGRVYASPGFYWKGGIASVALWRSPLGSAEVTALYANGNRGVELRPGLAGH